MGVSGKQGSTTHIFTRSSLWWVEEQNTHNTTREKRGRRRSKSVQIWRMWTDLLQTSDWRLKRAWICAKLGELVLHLEYFDLVSWFEDSLSRASDLIGVLSVWVTAVSAQSSFGRWFVWVANGVRLSWNLVSSQRTRRSTCLSKFVHMRAVICEIWTDYRRGQNLWLLRW